MLHDRQYDSSNSQEIPEKIIFMSDELKLDIKAAQKAVASAYNRLIFWNLVVLVIRMKNLQAARHREDSSSSNGSGVLY